VKIKTHHKFRNVILHSCWSIDNFCIVVLVLSLLFASKTLLEKCFGKENRKEFGKKKRKREALPVGLAAQPAPGFPPTRSPAYGPGRAGARPTSLPLPPFCR
jgi:hypothetical protein